MSAGGQTPSWEELIRVALESRISDIHVALPGRVEAYDPATQTADVKPLIRRVLQSEDDEDQDIEEDLPVIPAVPVTALRAGPFYVHMPMQAGQTGQLLFNERSLDQFRAIGEERAPGDPRAHGLSGAVFIPTGLSKAADALSGLNGDDLELGEEGETRMKFPPGAPAEVHAGGATDFVALRSTVQQIIDAVAAVVISPGDGGATIKTAISNIALVPATKLKAE